MSVDVAIGFEQTSYTVEESGDAIELIVSIVGRTNRPLLISYNTLNDTAVGESVYNIILSLYTHHPLASGGSDFQQKSETITVSPSETQLVISIQVVSDNVLEGDEMFSVFLTSSEDGIIVDPNTAQVTIMDTSIGMLSLDITLIRNKLWRGFSFIHNKEHVVTFTRG